MTFNRSTFLVCLFLTLVTAAVYSPVRNHAFVNFDDDLYVTENPLVQSGLTWKGVLHVFTRPMLGFWHPLTMLSHMADWHFFGAHAGWHHLMNVLFHTLNALLLFLFLRNETGAVWRSALVAALFALHPLHVESVAWVSERKDVLSTLFWLWTMLAYGRYARRPGIVRYLCVLIPFVLGLMAKPMLVTLPLVLLLLDYWPLGRMGSSAGGPDNSNAGGVGAGRNSFAASRFGALFVEKVPLMIFSAVFCVLTPWAQEEVHAMASLRGLGLQDRIGNALVSYAAYVLKMFWPCDLAVYYPHKGTPATWKVLGAVLLLLLVTGMVIRALKRRPFLLTGWLWYLGTLVPVVGLVQVGDYAMADRFTYVPLIGLFLMLSWTVPDGLLRRRHGRAALACTAAGVLLLLAGWTSLQLGHWKDSLTLFEHTLRVTGDNAKAHNNLGTALVLRGRFEEAGRHFEEAIRIRPDHADALSNFGVFLGRQGRLAEAVAHHRKATRIKPHDPRTHNNLGIALAAMGQYEEAVQCYRTALRWNPVSPDLLNNLGKAYQALGRLEEAVEWFRASVQLAPRRALFHTNLGNALMQKGLFDEAEGAYQEAVRLEPDAASAAYNGLATLHGSKGRFEEAVRMRKEALRIDPQNGAAHYYLAVEYYFLKEYAMARAHADRAMALGFRGVERGFLEQIERTRAVIRNAD